MDAELLIVLDLWILLIFDDNFLVMIESLIKCFGTKLVRRFMFIGCCEEPFEVEVLTFYNNIYFIYLFINLFIYNFVIYLFIYIYN
jgi:hypothetical protein